MTLGGLRLAAVTVGLAWCVLDARAAPEPSLLVEPFTLVDGFEGDGLGQWASYPPAQDVGYEPSLTPTTEDPVDAGRALMRVWQPVRDGRLRLGFIKHVPFVVSTDMRIGLRFRLEPVAGDAQLRVTLAGADGNRYVSHLDASADRWQNVTLDAGVFRSDAGRALAADTRIEAVAIEAILPRARRSITYRFLIDDVRLRGSRSAQFQLSVPAVTRRNPWPEVTANRSYAPGDRVAIAARSPAELSGGPAVLSAISCEIVDPAGRAVASIPLTRGGDRAWRLPAYALPADAAPGIWRARLGGTAAGGQSMETVIRFRVRRSSPAGHPRLYFDEGRRVDFERRTTDPRLRALWVSLQKAAVTYRGTGDLSRAGDVFQELDSRYLLPGLLGYFDALNRARLRIEANAFNAFVTGDPASRDAARTALLQVAAWPVWAPPWFKAHGQHTYYPAGQLAAAVAFAYDLLYADLTDAERATVRQALLERSILPTYREYVLDNRVMANTSNWIAHTVGGAIIAAAAISGDGTPTEQAALEVPLGGLLQKIESHIQASYLPDGSYGEGISYQEFDAETLGPMLVAADRVFGIDYWARTHVLDSLTYPMHTLATPLRDSLDMGDSHPPGGHGIAPIAYQSTDPTVRWYVSHFEPRTVQDFIFFDDGVQPRVPMGSGSRVFDVKGNVVFRTGWDANDVVLLFRAGPTYNHNHADQGSFLLEGFGEPLATEAGWSDYYKDPYYATYFTQAVGHNTLLVDRNPQSQTIADTAQFAALDTHPRITSALTSVFYDSVAADLASVYGGRLSRYTRRMVFVKPSTVLVFDDAIAVGGPATFDWLLHVADQGAVQVADGAASYAGAHGALGLRWFTSTPTSMDVKAGHVPYGVFAARTPAVPPARPGYVDLATREAEPRAQFLVALTPAATRAGAASATNAIRRIHGAGWLGAEWSEGDDVISSMFRTGGDDAMRHEAWATDGAAATIRRRADRIVMLAMEQGTSLSREGVRQVGGSGPLSAAVRYRNTGMDVTVDAPEAADLFLRAETARARVTVDGVARSSGVATAAGELRLALSAGRHTMTVDWP